MKLSRIAVFLSVVVAPTVVVLAQDDRPIPFIHFAHDGYEEPSYFQEYEDLLGSDYMKRCVRRENPPQSGGSCRDLPKACLWGQQTCPPSGDAQPTTRCNCHDRVWSCQEFLCPTIDATCPVETPSTTTPDPICKTDLSCAYGQQSCCGLTLATEICSCQAGADFTCTDLQTLCSFPCPQVVDFVENSGPLFPGVDGPSVVIATQPPSDGTTLSPFAAPSEQTAGPTPQLDPEAFEFARTIWTEMYRVDFPQDEPLLWTARLEALPAEFLCQTTANPIDETSCSVTVREILEFPTELIAKTASIVTADGGINFAASDSFNVTDRTGLDEIIAQVGLLGDATAADEAAARVEALGLRAMVFRGHFLSNGGLSREAVIMARTSTADNDVWTMFPLCDWTLYATPEEFADNSTAANRALLEESNTAGLVSSLGGRGGMTVNSVLNDMSGGRSLMAGRHLLFVPSWCWFNVEAEAAQQKCGTSPNTIDPTCRFSALVRFFERRQLILNFCWYLMWWCWIWSPWSGCWWWIWQWCCWYMNWNCQQLLQDMMACINCMPTLSPTSIECCPTATPGNQVFGGTVSEDTDSDRLGDTSLEGCAIRLTEQDTGALVATTLTDQNGCYWFETPDGPPVRYNIVETVKRGYREVSDSDGADPDTIGTDGTGGCDNHFVIEVLECCPTIANSQVFGGTVRQDRNLDGLGDFGLNRVVISLNDENAGGALVATTMTDGSGCYWFETPATGAFKIVQAVSAGFKATSDADGGALDRINTDGTGCDNYFIVEPE